MTGMLASTGRIAQQRTRQSLGATVEWSGGDPNGFVTITGVSLISNGFTPGSVSLSPGFVCGERISAGQFTVPAWITSAMPIPGAD